MGSCTEPPDPDPAAGAAAGAAVESSPADAEGTSDVAAAGAAAGAAVWGLSAVLLLSAEPAGIFRGGSMLTHHRRRSRSNQ